MYQHFQLLLCKGCLSPTCHLQSSREKNSIELFRWMYFFALWPVLWVVVRYFNNRLFRFIEWLFYREALYYLDSVKRTARAVIFMVLILPWFTVIFQVAWCEDWCSGVSYKQVRPLLGDE